MLVDSLVIYGTAFLFGALIGSFLNVCVYRLPRGESIVWPSSYCPTCQTRIVPYDNVPILSYLWLRGRCRTCRARIPFRYPLIELINGLGYAVILWHFGMNATSAAYAILFSSLVAVTWIDLSHQIIPDVITLPGIVFGLMASSTILPTGLLNAVAGVIVGGGLLWLLAWISPYVFGKEGMGGGDIKLMAMIGAFLGWKPTLLAIMLGATVGSLVGLGLILLRVIRRDDYVPFGPFLAIGAIFALFFHREIVSWYVNLFVVAQ